MRGRCEESGGADFRSDEKRRIHVGQVGNLRPIGNRPLLACKRAPEPGGAFFKSAVMTLRVAESDAKYKRRVFLEGAVMTLRVAEGDEKYKRRVFFDGARAYSGQDSYTPAEADYQSAAGYQPAPRGTDDEYTI